MKGNESKPGFVSSFVATGQEPQLMFKLHFSSDYLINYCTMKTKCISFRFAGEPVLLRIEQKTLIYPAIATGTEEKHRLKITGNRKWHLEIPELALRLVPFAHGRRSRLTFQHPRCEEGRSSHSTLFLSQRSCRDREDTLQTEVHMFRMLIIYCKIYLFIHLLYTFHLG